MEIDGPRYFTGMGGPLPCFQTLGESVSTTGLDQVHGHFL